MFRVVRRAMYTVGFIFLIALVGAGNLFPTIFTRVGEYVNQSVFEPLQNGLNAAQNQSPCPRSLLTEGMSVKASRNTPIYNSTFEQSGRIILSGSTVRIVDGPDCREFEGEFVNLWYVFGEGNGWVKETSGGIYNFALTASSAPEPQRFTLPRMSGQLVFALCIFASILVFYIIPFAIPRIFMWLSGFGVKNTK